VLERVSHADRDATVRQLVTACSEGRLSLAEFEERVEASLAATTRQQLQEATVDLPAAPPAVEAVRDRRWSVSFIGGTHTRGSSRLPRHLIHVSVIGNATIDLDDAELSGPETTITLVSLIGRSQVRVPSAVRSELSGFTFIGGRHVTGARPALRNGPLIHVRAFSFIGGATIRPSGSRWRRLVLAR
jgi:DUF1707 SHOCT-like domain